MNERSREVFRRVVEGYLDTGDPVGSRTLTRAMTEKVSAATIRNVMQDLEFLGLLGSPHVSAGRIPTQLGLRMFVDGLLEVADLSQSDRAKLDATLGANERDDRHASGPRGIGVVRVTQGASLVLAPKHEAPIKHIEFVSLSPDRALVVLVFADGHVENRVFTPPMGQTPSSMREAANFLNALAEGRTLSELRGIMQRELQTRRQEIDSLARELVETGAALWENEGQPYERLIVRGRANLLGGSAEAEELDRIRLLFDDLERKRDIVEFLELAETGEGVRIFIGSENKLFSLSGSALVVSPYMNADRKIVGAVGVIGPTRLNYGRIVPIVDYTAQLVGRMISGPDLKGKRMAEAKKNTEFEAEQAAADAVEAALARDAEGFCDRRRAGRAAGGTGRVEGQVDAGAGRCRERPQARRTRPARG
jgi:heat-inducible transcriptional repressor